MQPYRFEGNRFERCVGAGFIFTGGVGGPVTIINNTFLQCGGLAIAIAPMSEAPQNQNITFEKNILTDGPFLANFFATGRNIFIRGNTFTNTHASKGDSTAAFICCSTLERVVIENNIFRNMRAPENSAEIIAGERPLFRGNQYLNPELRNGQGLTFISNSARVVRPIYEEARIESDAPNIEVILSVDRYPDGQEVTFTGGSATNPVKFASGATTYQVVADRLLNGNNSLRLRFNKALGKWIELP
jgi:Right handed beta helix region